MFRDRYLDKFELPPDIRSLLCRCSALCFPETKDELTELCYGPNHSWRYDVSYSVEGRGIVKEAEVVRCKNGPCVNFMEDYMRRRDPDSMRLGDELPGDKPRFREVYGYDFEILRRETCDWLAAQKLLVLPFMAGGRSHGYPALLLCPMNAAFFALALANMQGFLSAAGVGEGFSPRGFIFLAPPFRHSHFEGRQVVVHRREPGRHDIFAYNLYPGPSAKKGVFSMLLDIGEQEGWVTNHASAALLESPYENRLVIMHEGASGGGKSELLEQPQRTDDGRMLIGRNIVSGERHYLTLRESCRIQPIADDMVLAKREFQDRSGRLVIADGEEGWFLRVDGDKYYGNSPMYERLSIHPPCPLQFFNIEGVPGATCLIWEHISDSDGRPCTNPRVISPRELLGSLPSGHIHQVDVRSFGVRMPPSTGQNPDYGIMGLMQLVPASVAWLWRLVSPRGYNNPSINDSKGSSLKSEGVGSYWPFATGERVRQANLLLRQLLDTPRTLNILIPNQHIGAYETGFAPQWLAREYLVRRGGRLSRDKLIPARCALMGWSLNEMKIDGQYVRRTFLRPELQSQLGESGYDAGAKILTDFFALELENYLTPELDPMGRDIIKLCLAGAPLEDYLALEEAQKP